MGDGKKNKSQVIVNLQGFIYLETKQGFALGAGNDETEIRLDFLSRPCCHTALMNLMVFHLYGVHLGLIVMSEVYSTVTLGIFYMEVENDLRQAEEQSIHWFGRCPIKTGSTNNLAQYCGNYQLDNLASVSTLGKVCLTFVEKETKTEYGDSVERGIIVTTGISMYHAVAQPASLGTPGGRVSVDIFLLTVCAGA